MAKGRLLIVDDSPDDRDLMQRRLGKFGYDVAVAGDGELALAMIAETSFDLMILDVMMPGIDGMEVLRRLRSTHPAAQLPVIMVTASLDIETQVTAVKLGASHFIVKPVVIETAAAWIEKLLRSAPAET